MTSPDLNSDSGIWFVMFREPAVSMEEIASRLRAFRDWSVSLRRQPDPSASPYIEIAAEGQVVAVGLNEGELVAEESREIAEGFAAGRAEQPAIAACDRRFEIAYELRADMANFNLVCSVEHALKQLVAGQAFTFMPADGMIV